ncbi:hypothetical protein PRIPAC_75228 [Pristionchus pacificus]|uniref:Uncharacterized protein n=1 Tax=Pristionchus pacificus TaxID=54126 RepID=A0A454XZE7_PRIPA|nr:hypothetical protein PRIPAC_75228 [Pristionchus pacificus]|eukprot:PDM81256.1 hypothetical protein PRIPAC_36259 [Pristionchus pacificus]
MTRLLVLHALCFGAVISVDKGDYVKPVTRRAFDAAATTIKPHAEAFVRRTHVPPIFPKEEATTARVVKLVDRTNDPISHGLPKLYTIIPPRLPKEDLMNQSGTARPKRFVFHRRTIGTRPTVVDTGATVTPKNATGVEATTRIAKDSSKTIAPILTQGPKEIKGSGLIPGFVVPRPSPKPLPKSGSGALPTEPVVPRKIEATTSRIERDPSKTLGPIVIRPGTERPKANETAHVTPKYVIGTGAMPLTENLKTGKAEATTARSGDSSRTIGPIVNAPGSERPKREAGVKVDVTKNSGNRPIFSGGVQGSKTNGDTTWTGGINHSTDGRNGNTQVNGGFQTKVGSGTVHGGAQVNIDNHGRTNHGVNVGVSIPF